MQVYKKNKLVRDKIPQELNKNGGVAISRILNDKDYSKSLLEKLVEEVNEVAAAKTTEQLKDEIADLCEVIDAILINLKVSKKEIRHIQTNKKQKKGGFKKRIFLESVE